MQKEEKNKKEKYFSKKVVILGLGTIILVVFVSLLVTVRANYVAHDWARSLAGVLRYPVLVTFRPFSLLTANELQRDMKSLRQFYESQDFASLGMRIDFTTEDGMNRLKVREKELLNKHVEDAVIESIVRKNGQKVSMSEVSQRVDRKMNEFGSRDQVLEELNRLYGWDIKDFEKNVVQVELYQEKALDIFNNRADKSQDEAAHKKIEEAKAALDGGASFGDAVAKYSEGLEAGQGGEVGWILPAQTEPAIADALITLSPGDTTDIIESSLGFHIIRLEETRDESNGRYYRISQIFTKKETFYDWVRQSIRKARVFPMVSAYTWNRDDASVEFTDENMREFEKNMVETVDVSDSTNEK